MTRGRFAPSPTGRMHLGNVFCALLSWLSAKSKGGEWVLRIEDLDPQRSRREYALQLMDDLQWLGLPWDGEPVWQSQRGHIYEEYLHRLTEMGLTYPCFCTRADIMATQAPHETDGRVVYKGTCRPKDVISDAENDVADTACRVPTASEEDNSFNVQRSTFAPQTVPLRQGANEVFREMTECHFVPHEGSTIQCDAGPVRERSGGGGLTAHPSPLTAHLATTRLIVPDCTIPFTDGHYGRHDINLAEHCGDYIIRRKDGAWAYQLAVVVDDALMGVTEIVRGRDLLLSSPQQIHLRNLLFQSTDDRVQMTEYRVQSTENRVQMTDVLLKRKTITDAARSVPTTTSPIPHLSPSETGGVPQSGEGVDSSLNVNSSTIIADTACRVPTATSLNVYPSTLTPHNSPSETGGVPQSGEGVDNSLNVNTPTIITDAARSVPTATSLNVYPSTLTPHNSPSETGGVPQSGEGVDNSLNVYSSTIIADTACRVPTATSLNVYPSTLTPHNSPSETGGVPQCGEGVDNSLNVYSPTIITDAARSVPTATSLNVYNSPSETGGVPRSGEGVDSSFNVNSSTIIADTACRVPTATSLNVYPSFTPHPSPLTVHPSPLTVTFLHHPLLCNAEGQRLCKRDKSMDLGYLRDKGTSPQEIIGLLAHLAGLTDTPAPISPQELIPLFSWDKVPTEDILLDHRITL